MTDVVDSLLVYHKGIIRVAQSCVNVEDEIVGLNNSGGNLGDWVKRECQLGLWISPSLGSSANTVKGSGSRDDKWRGSEAL